MRGSSCSMCPSPCGGSGHQSHVALVRLSEILTDNGAATVPAVRRPYQTGQSERPASAVREGSLCRRPEVPVDQVASLGYHGGGTSRTSSLPRNRAVHSAWCLSRRSARAYKTLVSTTITSSAGYRPKPSASSSSARSDTSVRPLSPIPMNAGQARDARRSGSCRQAARAIPGDVKPAPRRTRRQAAAAAPWLSYPQLTRVSWILIIPAHRRRSLAVSRPRRTVADIGVLRGIKR